MNKKEKTSKIRSPLDRQREIYIKGVSGELPIIPLNFSELEAKAKERLSTKAYAYIAGSAGEESTALRNTSAFHKWSILPRMLKDVSDRDISISLFGKRLPSPFLLSPIGVQELFHKDADLATARAASSLDIPMIFSNQASYAMEETAAQMGDSPRWFQLYWSKSNEMVASFVRRAEACACDAIVVTLDTTMLGWRQRDLDLGYLPFMEGKGIAQYISDPIFQRLLSEPAKADDVPVKPKITLDTLSSLVKLMSRYPGGFFENLRTQIPRKAVKQFVNIYSRTTLTWDDLSFLRKHTSLPILLKGILHPDDAHKAVEYGMDGIVVSNHGGRQIDGSVSSIEMLPEIVTAVAGQIPVLMDSGVRTGADAFKALALGATGVCVGRPYAYGLALAGEAGVRDVLLNLLAEFELTMGLAGCRSIEEIGMEMLREG